MQSLTSSKVKMDVTVFGLTVIVMRCLVVQLRGDQVQRGSPCCGVLSRFLMQWNAEPWVGMGAYVNWGTDRSPSDWESREGYTWQQTLPWKSPWRLLFLWRRILLLYTVKPIYVSSAPWHWVPSVEDYCQRVRNFPKVLMGGISFHLYITCCLPLN